jgi:hypothetical protein
LRPDTHLNSGHSRSWRVDACRIETQLGFDEVPVDRLDSDCSGSYRGGHPLDRSAPDVADGEDAEHARFHGQGKASERPASLRPSVLQEVRASDYIASPVDLKKNKELTSALEPLSCSLGVSCSTVGRRARAFSLSSRQFYLPGALLV